jgi:hypothetical protein
VSCERQEHRRGPTIGLVGTNALQVGHDVSAVDATQHQGFQIHHGHGRPPAIKKKSSWPTQQRANYNANGLKSGYTTSVKQGCRTSPQTKGDPDIVFLSENRAFFQQLLSELEKGHPEIVCPYLSDSKGLKRFAQKNQKKRMSLR